MNRMGNLIDKIERHLGVKPLNLDSNICKDTWANVIISDSITTFSRYFPNVVMVLVDSKKRTPDGYCLIDEDLLGKGVEILGVKDINWEFYTSVSGQFSAGFSVNDYYTGSLGADDIALSQVFADHKSLFKANTIFVDFKEPNKIKFTTNMSNTSKLHDKIPVDVLINHTDNLMTIPPTMMETFEQLAEADIARYLYEYLKNFDGTSTAYFSLDMKLSDLQSAAQKRDDIVQLLKDSYVNPSNVNQPVIICV